MQSSTEDEPRPTHFPIPLLLLLIFGIVIGAVFFSRFEPASTALLRAARAGLAAMIVLLASWSCGTLALSSARLALVRFGGLPSDSPQWSPLDRFLAGVPMYGLLVTVIAWVGAALSTTISVLTVLLAIAGLIGLRSLRKLELPQVPRGLWLFMPPLGFALIGALTPVSSPDELIYKLAIPRAYELFGRMLELPLNSDSYFPAALYMADLGAMILSGGVAAKLVHLAIWTMTLRVIWRFTQARFPGSELWTTAILAWTPALMLIAGWCWAEWGMIGLLLLSLGKWEDFLDHQKASDLAVSLVCLAGALSSKYTALPWLVVFLVLVIWRLSRLQLERRGRLFAAGFAVVVLWGGLFYVRNMIWTGSPVAPFLLPQSPAVSNYRSTLGGWGELIRGYDILHPGIIDDSLGILLPLAVLLSLPALRGRGRIAQDLFLMGAVQLLGLVTFAPTSRLMLLALVPLGILGSTVMVEQWRSLGRVPGVAILFGSGIALAGQLILAAFVFVTSYDLMTYFVGAETTAKYLSRTRSFYAPYSWIEANTHADSRIFVLGENRTFYLTRPFIAAGNLDGPRIASYLDRFSSPEALAAEMRRQRITHVLIHKQWYRVKKAGSAELSMLEKEYLLEVSPKTDRLVREYLRTFGRPRYNDRTYVIFEVR